jgi:hypothetical protein
MLMDALATVVLRRVGAIALPASTASPADGPAWVAAFEADLAARGWLLGPSLRRGFAGLDAAVRTRWADWVLAVADEMVGADRDHVPLFRAFPDTPVAPEALFVERLLVHLFQAENAPCVLCGVLGRVRPLDPCGHVVCEVCFDPAAFSACPVCGRRLNGDGAYLTVEAPKRDERTGRRPDPLRLRRITLDEAAEDTVTRLRDDLVARPSALNETDVADLHTLVAATVPGRLDWLPTTVPARETLALVVAWALHAAALTDTYPRVVADASARWTTMTDVARALWAYSGGDPGLIVPRAPSTDGPGEVYRPVAEPRVVAPAARVRTIPRPLRRAVLSFVDSLDPATAAEDAARHPVIWKRIAERLHPFESVGRNPDAGVVFATLRGTRAQVASPLGQAMTHACGRQPDRLLLASHSDGTISVRVRTFAALVEDTLAEGDTTNAVTLLRQRPGDLWRRLDHLLRLAGDDHEAQRLVLDAAARSAFRVSPTVLAGAAAALAGRDQTVAVPAAVREAAATQVADPIAEAAGGVTQPAQVGAVGTALRRALGLGVRTEPGSDRGPEPGTPRRTFFPKGDVVRTWTTPERRTRLPLDAITDIRRTVDAELAGRAAHLPRFDLALLDATLARVPAPMRERASSEQLAGWPRGSVRTIVDAETVRLFLHWVDGDTFRVDLDLSCAFYSADWHPVGHCDYTRLRFKRDAAIHSGDLTSAPPPLGATEFLDLNRTALAAAGVHWAVPVVFSYNDVPFESLTAAFAGLSLPAPGGTTFDAARVMQKFGLRGNARSLAAMILNVADGELMWIDANLATRGYGHAVGPNGARLGRLAADLWEHFNAGNRTTALDVAAWHAAARADRIAVVHPNGTATTIVLDDPASTVAAIRTAATADGAGADTPVPTSSVFTATTDPDRLTAIAGTDVTEGSLAMLLDGRAPAPWHTVNPADLAAGLVPAEPA